MARRSWPKTQTWGRIPKGRATLEQTGRVASEDRDIFHRPNCKWAKLFKNKGSYVQFPTREVAIRAEYKPCRTCCS